MSVNLFFFLFLLMVCLIEYCLGLYMPGLSAGPGEMSSWRFGAVPLEADEGGGEPRGGP